MMTPVDMEGLLAGDAAAAARVLHTCRFEGFGAEAYGSEAVAAALRAGSSAVREAVVYASARAAAVVGTDVEGCAAGLFADLHDGWITRLWRLGAGVTPTASAPKVGVPSDLDMDQRGGRLAFDPMDHPGLSGAGAEAIRALGEHWLAEQPAEVVGGLTRVRPLVLRADSVGNETVALFRLQGSTAHGRGGFYALAVFSAEAAPVVVVDAGGQEAAEAAPWRPRTR